MRTNRKWESGKVEKWAQIALLTFSLSHSLTFFTDHSVLRVPNSALQLAQLRQPLLYLAARPRIVTTADVTDGLVSRWKLDDGSGPTADDDIGSNDGTVTDATWTGSGHIGGALVLDGSGDRVFFGTSTTIAPVAMSASLWVKCSALTPAYSAVLSRHTNDVEKGYYQLFVKSNGKLAVYLWADGGGGANVFYDGDGSYTLSTDIWYHLAFTYNSTAGLKGYVNGALDGSAAANGALVQTGAPAFLGFDSGTPGRDLAGTLDEVRIYNRALTADEVLTLSNQ